jgi:RNA-directed DNA polymerase
MKHPWNSQAFAEGARKAGRTDDVIEAANAAALKIKRTNPDLPVILTLSHLGHLADVAPEALRRIIDRKVDPYRVFRVKKRAPPGKGTPLPRRYRTICVPIPALMRVQRWIAQHVLNAVEPHSTSHAFAPGRDLVGAANQHVGARWLVKMDVLNFFECILEPVVYRVFHGLGYGELVAFEMAQLCTRPHLGLIKQKIYFKETSEHFPYKPSPIGHLPQGAPTSPMLANLAVRELDERLDALARERGWKYTRYADDLAFSTIEPCTRGRAMTLASLAERELSVLGLKANRQKTAIVPPGARKILLGVLVDRESPRLTRSFRNNIETHLYALTHPSIGPAAHRKKRGFASIIGMRHHVQGLIAFAHQIDPVYAVRLYSTFNRIDWRI